MTYRWVAQAGFTLLELVLVVVILSVVGVGMLTLIHNTTNRTFGANILI